MALFGTSGIRGVFGREVTGELALAVGRAVVRAVDDRVVVARDTRASGLALENAFVAGVLEAGGEVLRAGIAPTPALALASKRRGCAGAMMTASHNPPEYNGIKLFERGNELSARGERRVERAMGKARVTAGGVDERLEGVVEEHIALALAGVDVGTISERAPKVVVDSANGAASVATPYALRRAGCKVVGLNCDVSGDFARGLEPNETNLQRTGAFVRACGADFGIAHDGDGDRCVILDERGKMLGLDVQLALMAGKALEKRKGVIVTTVEASLAVREAVEERGGRLIITPVGSRGVAEAMRRSAAVFGGEPCGEYIFPGELTVPDGIATALHFAEMFAEAGKLSELASQIKVYPMRRAKIPCSNKERAMAVIRREASRLGGRQSTIDGVRVDFEEGWMLIRPSGTEPVIRITCEHHSEKGLRELWAKAQAIVKRAVR
ncbi:MAG: phosphoglucosamine mutase [Candidatus Micrarchaeia archaeon]